MICGSYCKINEIFIICIIAHLCTLALLSLNMIQLITALPFDLSALTSLKKDWNRFQDGLVTLNEIPDAVRDVFECEAEVIPQECEFEEGDSENKEDDTSALVPSGKGKLILTARY